MFIKQYLKLLFTSTSLIIATFYFIGIASAHVIYVPKTYETFKNDNEYAYQDIYSTLIPDEQFYPNNFPYELTLIYNMSIDFDNSFYEQDLNITAVRVYDGERLIQEIPTISSALYIPEFEDLNSDGYLDLAIPQTSTFFESRTTSITYAYWIYNPLTKLFEATPQKTFNRNSRNTLSAT